MSPIPTTIECWATRIAASSRRAYLAADIVIGQPDMSTAVCNFPNGDPMKPTQSSLCFPVGLLVDSAGNLYVADSGNGRVLRFPTPFSHAGNQVADVVLGQSDFFTRIADAGSRNMAAPYGLAFAGTNGLLVSDSTLNRVLFFPFTNGTFTGADNGKAATKVFGQLDFTSSQPGAGDTQMNSPHHLSADTSVSAETITSKEPGRARRNSVSSPCSSSQYTSLLLAWLNIPPERSTPTSRERTDEGAARTVRCHSRRRGATSNRCSGKDSGVDERGRDKLWRAIRQAVELGFKSRREAVKCALDERIRGARGHIPACCGGQHVRSDRMARLLLGHSDRTAASSTSPSINALGPAVVGPLDALAAA